MSEYETIQPRPGAKRHTLMTSEATGGPPASREKAKRRVEPGDAPVAILEAAAAPEPPSSIRKRKE